MDVVDDMQISLFAPSSKLLEEFKKEIDSIASSQGTRMTNELALDL